jgi:CheY-like chemotaxis protein
VRGLAAPAPTVYVDAVEPPGVVIRRILLVEDDPGMREAIRRLLERAGFSVTAAGDGAEAWELLSRGPRPAAILTDLYTPRMTGHDLVARVRRTPRLAGIPIIAMSADHAPRPWPAAEAFLEKPFSSEQLDSALEHVGADV